MGGLYGLVDGMLRAAHITLAPWMGPAVAVAVALLTSPWWWGNQRVDRARRLVTRSQAASLAERARLDAEVDRLLAGRPDRMLTLAEFALANGRTDLGERLLAELERRGVRGEGVRRLRRSLEPPVPPTALLAALRVERMRAEGLDAEADRLLARALARWPADAELQRLRPVAPASQPPSGA